MIQITTVFWIFIAFFILIGATRGWAKEILVTFSLLLALFLNTIFEQFLGDLFQAFQQQSTTFQFYSRIVVLTLLTFFGYETPRLSRMIANKSKRDRLENVLLGGVIGALNGWLLVGSFWWYLSTNGYPIEGISPPVGEDAIQDAAVILSFAPPELITTPLIYFLVAAAFVFVLVVLL